jgi:hypothetical protein
MVQIQLLVRWQQQLAVVLAAQQLDHQPTIREATAVVVVAVVEEQAQADQILEPQGLVAV